MIDAPNRVYDWEYSGHLHCQLEGLGTASASTVEQTRRIMAHRGHLDGLMRHGAFSGAGLSGRQPLEPSPATILEILENKLAVQTAEAEKLIRENQRLADSHAALRKDIIGTETEMQMIRTHLGDVQVETDMHMRDLVERIRLMEADIRAGEAVMKELHQVHMEAKRLIAERQRLTNDVEAATKELQKYSGDNSNLAELVAELDGLRKEHHGLRSAFEYEKNTNIKQVEQMRTMEMNLITMTKEADKLRADLANAANRAHAAQVTPPQPGTAQAAAASAATNPYASYAQPNYPGTYAAPQHPVASGAATDATSAYGAAGSTGYPAAPVQASSGAANAGQAPPAPYPATYDPTKAAQR
ncbi:hypothetical protein ZWY2020_059459 [Hordeum vulgare]|nr:hypothetical protein ZWY2020_059459 [Hordeum vulgare]